MKTAKFKTWSWKAVMSTIMKPILNRWCLWGFVSSPTMIMATRRMTLLTFLILSFLMVGWGKKKESQFFIWQHSQTASTLLPDSLRCLIFIEKNQFRSICKFKEMTFDINVTTYDGKNALYYSAYYGYLNTSQILLER